MTGIDEVVRHTENLVYEIKRSPSCEAVDWEVCRDGPYTRQSASEKLLSCFKEWAEIFVHGFLILSFYCVNWCWTSETC